MVGGSTPDNDNSAKPENEPQGTPPEAAGTPGTENVETAINWAEQIELVQGLARVAAQEGLSELDLERDGIRITIKGPVEPTPLPAHFQIPPQSAMYLPGATPAYAEMVPGFADHTDEIAEAPAEDKNLVPVVSPMVGVFYRASSPDDPPFVEVNDTIEVGQVIGIIEAMKVFNEIISEVEGTVVEIRAQNAQLVETGAVIMTIRTP